MSKVYVILVDGSVDQIVETEAQAKKERRDLIKMDCGKVTIREFNSWEEAEAFETKKRGY